MNTHHTILKGDIAVQAVVLDLTRKGYYVSKPLSEGAPYDLICDTGVKLLKIQVKYRENGMLPSKTVWMSSVGTISKDIPDDAFDYYALVDSTYTKICYPSIDYKGLSIRWEYPISFHGFYYWEDFLGFTDFGVVKRKADKLYVTNNKKVTGSIYGHTKITWPSKDEMTKLVWQYPSEVLGKMIGVSGSAIAKHCKSHGISKPPRGYWKKLLHSAK